MQPVNNKHPQKHHAFAYCQINRMPFIQCVLLLTFLFKVVQQAESYSIWYLKCIYPHISHSIYTVDADPWCTYSEPAVSSGSRFLLQKRSLIFYTWKKLSHNYLLCMHTKHCTESVMASRSHHYNNKYNNTIKAFSSHWHCRMHVSQHKLGTYLTL